MNFERLYFLRENKDLTQTEMGNILKVSRVAISQWENNKEIIPLDKLNIYSNYFNVSLDYIVGLSNKKQTTNLNIELDKKIIGTRIKDFRKKFNISQEQLANELNTSHSTISAYEKGKTLILTVFAYTIAKNYKISLDWLCGKKLIYKYEFSYFFITLYLIYNFNFFKFE